MAKVNVNKASQDELVEAGLRPVVAEAVLKARDESGGKLANVDALKEALKDARGIGPATLDQLGDLLAFGAPAAKNGADAGKDAADKGADTAKASAEAGAEATRRTAETGADVARRGAEAGAEVTRRTAETGAEATRRTAEAGAEVARRTVEAGAEATRRTAEAGAEATRRTAEAGAEVARRTAERTADVTSIAARGGVEAAQRGAEVVERTAKAFADAERKAVERSSQAATELGQLVVSLVNEQIQANVETLRALSRARNWREALEVQNAYLRGSVERAASGTNRYMETVARLMTSVVKAGREEARKAA